MTEWHMLPHTGRVPPIAPLAATYHRIQVPGEGGDQHNPSVFEHEGKLRVLVRILRSMRTTNYVADMAPDGALSNARRVDVTDPSLRPGTQVEDLRVFSWQGRLWAVAAVHMGGNPPPVIRQGLCEMTEAGAVIPKVHEQPSQRQEKNWMPLVEGDSLRFVYSTSPLLVTKLDPGSMFVNPPAREMPAVTGHVRGGTPLVPYKDGYLAVVHEVYRPKREPPNYNPLLGFFAPMEKDPVAGDVPTIYVHRFVRFDRALSRAELSEPFYFRRIGTEFCAGALWRGDKLLLSFGSNENEAWIAYVDPMDIARLFGETPEIEPIKDDHPPAMDVEVVHSAETLCGIHQYGKQLDRALADWGVRVFESSHKGFGHHSPLPRTLLVHFEPILAMHDLRERLRAERARGRKVVLCCHWYEAEALREYEPVVDVMVVHKRYPNVASKAVHIPLACPEYDLSKNATARRASLRARHGFADGETVLTTVGFLSEWKKTHELVAALSPHVPEGVRVVMQMPKPFRGSENEEAKVRSALTTPRIVLQTSFLSDEALLDLVAASDLGFLYHPIHTGSASAACKQFVSARTPLVATDSNHTADVTEGVVRAPIDPAAFAQVLLAVAADKGRLAALRGEMMRLYDRINMLSVAGRYRSLFERIG